MEPRSILSRLGAHILAVVVVVVKVKQASHILVAAAVKVKQASHILVAAAAVVKMKQASHILVAAAAAVVVVKVKQASHILVAQAFVSLIVSTTVGIGELAMEPIRISTSSAIVAVFVLSTVAVAVVEAIELGRHLRRLSTAVAI